LADDEFRWWISPIVLDVIQILRGDRLAVLFLDFGRKLLLAHALCLPRFRENSTKRFHSHITIIIR